MKSESTERRYRRYAAECEANADKSTNEVDRLAWRRLAEDWTTLAQGAEVDPRRDRDSCSADAAAAG